MGFGAAPILCYAAAVAGGLAFNGHGRIERAACLSGSDSPGPARHGEQGDALLPPPRQSTAAAEAYDARRLSTAILELPSRAATSRAGRNPRGPGDRLGREPRSSRLRSSCSYLCRWTCPSPSPSTGGTRSQTSRSPSPERRSLSPSRWRSIGRNDGSVTATPRLTTHTPRGPP